jgi:hypothetical protein
MKKYLLPFLLTLFFLNSIAQSPVVVKILDSNVDWQSQNLTVYLSDSTITSVTIQLGTQLHAYDIFNQTYTAGTTVSVTDNMLVIPLTNVTQGVYYVDVRITDSGNHVSEMEYQTVN